MGHRQRSRFTKRRLETRARVRDLLAAIDVVADLDQHVARQQRIERLRQTGDLRRLDMAEQFGERHGHERLSRVEREGAIEEVALLGTQGRDEARRRVVAAARRDPSVLGKEGQQPDERRLRDGERARKGQRGRAVHPRLFGLIDVQLLDDARVGSVGEFGVEIGSRLRKPQDATAFDECLEGLLRDVLAHVGRRADARRRRAVESGLAQRGHECRELVGFGIVAFGRRLESGDRPAAQQIFRRKAPHDERRAGKYHRRLTQMESRVRFAGGCRHARESERAEDLGRTDVDAHRRPAP